MGITIAIPTKARYDCLDKTLLSIAFQTLKPEKIIIVDDTDQPLDVRTVSHYRYILDLLLEKGIQWDYVFGLRKGQHFSHQYVQEHATTDYIFRIDDDEVAEPTCLRKLMDTMKSDKSLGAVAPSVTIGNPQILPVGLRNRMTNLDRPNMQWFKGEGTYDADHLYSCFLYKRGIVSYDLNLSPAAHREETIFTHSIKRAGYKLAVNMDARVYHFREEKGGIRANPNPQFWEHDEKYFQGMLNLWGIQNDNKMIILDNGVGDHFAFKNILPELRKKYKNITIAATFPDVFWDEPDLKLISIHEAKLMYGEIANYNVYKYMADHNWNKSIVEAFKGLYLDGKDNNIAVQRKDSTNREAESQKLSNGILAAIAGLPTAQL